VSDGLLTFVSGIFVWKGDFSTKGVPKAAGFRWHGGGCKASCPACAASVGKAWWTGDVDKAAALEQHADDAARERMAGAVRDVEASAAVASDIEVPAPEGLALLPFQRAAVDYAMRRPRTLLGEEMGLGKSVEALGFVNTVTEIRSVLVVCPASLTLNWLYEARRWLVPGPRPSWTFHVVQPGIRPPPDANFVIVADSRVGGRGSAGAAAVLAALLERRWGCLIVDEAHRFKSEDAARSQAVMGIEARPRKKIEGVPGLVDRADRVLMLTGTPLLNRPAEMWNLLRTLDPVVWASRWPFYKQYCDAHKEKIGHGKWAKYVWNIAGASNLEELQRKLRTVMCRRMKCDVLQELPPKRYQLILLPADGLRAEIEGERTLWLGHEMELAALEAECESAGVAGDEAAYAAAVDRLTVRQRAAFRELSAARHRLAVAKIPLCAEHILGALESGARPLVVFAHHHDVVDGIRDFILEAGYSCATITGDTVVEARSEEHTSELQSLS
jgi:SWI/SNF-related matrix-associated actin-dependent regulator 1 of chromatin subfamily A